MILFKTSVPGDEQIHFVLFPTRLESGEVVWLEKVKRIRRHGVISDYWTYHKILLSLEEIKQSILENTK